MYVYTGVYFCNSSTAPLSKHYHYYSCSYNLLVFGLSPNIECPIGHFNDDRVEKLFLLIVIVVILLFLLFFAGRLILKELILLVFLVVHLNLTPPFNLFLLSLSQLLLLLNYLFKLMLRQLFLLIHFYNYNIMESTTFTKIDEVKVDKNVDRIINIGPN